MRTRKRFQWAALLAVPLLMALAMWPVAVRRRARIRAQEARAATSVLRAKMAQDGIIRFGQLQQLLSRGADANVRVGDNDTLLHLMICEPKYSEAERAVTIRVLLEGGADANAVESDGTTPLMDAVDYTKPEVVRLLLDHGAQVNTQRRTGTYTTTALSEATQILQVFRDCCAEPDTTRTLQERHDLARDLRDTNRMVQMLKAAGAHE